MNTDLASKVGHNPYENISDNKGSQPKLTPVPNFNIGGIGIISPQAVKKWTTGPSSSKTIDEKTKDQGK
jgi:hypothetical protein